MAQQVEPGGVINSPLNIYQRINKVREGNSYIKKTKEIDGKYMVVEHDAVTRELRDDLIKWGIVIEPSLEGEMKTTDSGKRMGRNNDQPVIRVEGVYNVQFVNVDDPKDRAVMRVVGHAEDSGDKAPGKLLSYCVKGAMLKMFTIETGESDESRVDGATAAGGLSEQAMTNFKFDIDKIVKGQDPNPVWNKIAKACKEAKDKPAETTLRAYLQAHLRNLNKGDSDGQRSAGAARG